jgi:hypothetical protein
MSDNRDDRIYYDGLAFGAFFSSAFWILVIVLIVMID